MKVRLLPPTDRTSPTIVAGGRSYACAAGSFLDVPDFDANVLEANGWTGICEVGTTAERPTMGPTIQVLKGRKYFDTTLGKIVVHDGKVWRDPADASAV